jgi:hypothetical protein
MPSGWKAKSGSVDMMKAGGNPNVVTPSERTVDGWYFRRSRNPDRRGQWAPEPPFSPYRAEILFEVWGPRVASIGAADEKVEGFDRRQAGRFFGPGGPIRALWVGWYVQAPLIFQTSVA